MTQLAVIKVYETHHLNGRIAVVESVKNELARLTVDDTEFYIPISHLSMCDDTSKLNQPPFDALSSRDQKTALEFFENQSREAPRCPKCLKKRSQPLKGPLS